MYEPEGPLDSSKTSDRTQYENRFKGGVLAKLWSDSSFAAFRMNPTLRWSSMLATTSVAPPPWPAYDEFHSVLNDITSAVVYPASVMASIRLRLSVSSSRASAERPPAPPG
jgi:hypothetical protein